MDIWKHLNIHRKLTYSMLALAIVLGIGATTFSLWRLTSAMNAGLKTKAESLAVLIATIVKDGVQFQSQDPVEQGLSGLDDEVDITQAAVVSQDPNTKSATILAKSKPKSQVDLAPFADALIKEAAKDPSKEHPSVGKSGYLVMGALVKVQGADQKSYVLLLANKDRVGREQLGALVGLAVLGLLMLGIGMASAMFLSSAIVTPLEVIQKSMRDISEGEGDLTARLVVDGDDEIAQVAVHFNHFVENIHQIVRQVMTISTNMASGSLQKIGRAHV
jgi:methyl-accepting chemotaxis protein